MNILSLALTAENVSFWGKIVNFLKTQVLSTESTLTTQEKFSLAGEMVLRGMGTVFLVLIILWATIAIFGAVSKAAAKKEKAAVPASPSPSAPDTTSSDDAKIAAVIIAAIEAYRASEGLSGRPYRVVSFKKRNVKKSRGSDD